MDPRRSPKRVGYTHLADQLPNFQIDGGPSRFGLVLANSKLGENATCFSHVPSAHAPSDSSLHTRGHDRSADGPARRFTFGARRIRSHQASTLDCETLPPPFPEPPRLGSADCGV